MSQQWIEAVKGHDLASLATGLLGMRAGRMRTLGPCPACSADKRGSNDARLPIGAKGGGWHCHACGERGDAVELLSFSVLGRSSKGLDSAGWDQLQAWCRLHGLMDGVPESEGRPARGKRHTRTKSVNEILGAGKPSERPSKSVQGGSQGAQPPEETHRAGKGSRASRGPFKWRDGLADDCAAALWEDNAHAERVREYLLADRKLSEEAVRAFGLGLFVVDGEPHLNEAGRPYLTIPLVTAEERTVNVRFRSVPVPGTCDECEDPQAGCRKCREYRVCEGCPLPLFGAQNLGNDLSGPVLITEGELDVVALWTYGLNVSVVSGTAGAGASWENQGDWLDQLEPYESIVGLFDDDEAGEKGWNKLAEVLGPYRCARATLPMKDAGDCLMAGVPRDRVERAIGRARPAIGIEFRTVDTYSEQLEQLISNPQALRGVHTGSEKLDECLGGFRTGELIVATGDSGDGKTSCFTWLMLRQAQMGYPVAITSFEQQPIGTVQKLARIQLGGDFTKFTEDERRNALDELGRLPLRILHHYGFIEPTKLIESIRYAKRRHGVTRFMVDHLGYCTDQDADDERRAIDAVVKALAQLAVNEDILIVLIAHPHNVSNQRGWARVQARDLKGSSTIRQEAHVVCVVVKENPHISVAGGRRKKVKRPWPQSRFFFDKIRSEFGVSGSEAALAYDPGSCSLADEWPDTPSGSQGLLVPRRRALAGAPDDTGEEDDED